MLGWDGNHSRAETLISRLSMKSSRIPLAQFNTVVNVSRKEIFLGGKNRSYTLKW